MNYTSNMTARLVDTLVVSDMATTITNLNEQLEKIWGQHRDELIDNVLISKGLEDRLKNDPEILRHIPDIGEGGIAKIYGIPFRVSILPPDNGCIFCNHKGQPLYIVGSDGWVRRVPAEVREPFRPSFDWEERR